MPKLELAISAKPSWKPKIAGHCPKLTIDPEVGCSSTLSYYIPKKLEIMLVIGTQTCHTNIQQYTSHISPSGLMGKQLLTHKIIGFVNLWALWFTPWHIPVLGPHVCFLAASFLQGKMVWMWTEFWFWSYWNLQGAMGGVHHTFISACTPSSPFKGHQSKEKGGARLGLRVLLLSKWVIGVVPESFIVKYFLLFFLNSYQWS